MTIREQNFENGAVTVQIHTVNDSAGISVLNSIVLFVHLSKVDVRLYLTEQTNMVVNSHLYAQTTSLSECLNCLLVLFRELANNDQQSNPAFS